MRFSPGSIALTVANAAHAPATFLLAVDATPATIELTVTDILADAYRSELVEIGVDVQFDFGGGYESLPVDVLSESPLGAQIDLNESLDGPIDMARVTLFGSEFAPPSSLGRSKTPVRMIATYRAPYKPPASRSIFEGYVERGSFNTPPDAMAIEIFDRASVAANKLAHVNIPPGSLRMPEAIVREVLSNAGIEVGEIILPPTTKPRVKAISRSGDPALRWVDEFLSPWGARAAFVNGRLVIKRWAPEPVAERVLTESDVSGEINIAPPDTSSPNVITVSGTTYDHDAIQEDAAIGGTEISETVVYARAWTFSRPQAVSVQALDGSITDYGITYGPLHNDRNEISRVRRVRTRTADGFSETVTEWGWYTPKAAPLVQNADGSISYQFGYFYEDGSFSKFPVARYQIIRESTITETTTDDRSERIETIRGFGVKEEAIAQLNATLDEVPRWVYMTEDGVGWAQPWETYQTIEIRRSTSIADDEGFVASETTVIEAFGSTPSPRVNLAYVYGPANSPRYKRQIREEFRVTESEVVSYIQTSPETYIVRTEVTGEGQFTEQTRFGSRPSLRPSTAKAITGKSAFVTSTFRNELAIAMTDEFPEHRQNEYCESKDELAFVAKEIARDHAKHVITFKMPVDLTVHKGVTVTLDIPGFPLRGARLLVWNVSRLLRLSTGENQQTVTAYYYPEEVE